APALPPPFREVEPGLFSCPREAPGGLILTGGNRDCGMMGPITAIAFGDKGVERQLVAFNVGVHVFAAPMQDRVNLETPILEADTAEGAPVLRLLRSQASEPCARACFVE